MVEREDPNCGTFGPPCSWRGDPGSPHQRGRVHINATLALEPTIREHSQHVVGSHDNSGLTFRRFRFEKAKDGQKTALEQALRGRLRVLRCQDEEGAGPRGRGGHHRGCHHRVGHFCVAEGCPAVLRVSGTGHHSVDTVGGAVHGWGAVLCRTG